MLSQVTLTTAKEEYMMCCQVDGKAKRTLELNELVTRLFLEYLDGEQITPTRIRGFLINLSDTRNPTTVNIYARTLRVFIHYLVDNGYLDEDPMKNIRTPKTPRVFPNVLSEEEVSSIIKLAKKDKRDHAIVLFLLDAGVRATELCNLELDDISLTTRSARVFGKGSKERVVFFSDTTAKALSRWLSARPQAEYENALFLNCKGQPLTRHGLLKIIKRLGKMAGLAGKNISPHTLRHCFATYFIKEGGDPHSLMRLMGHTTTKMAEIYVNLVSKDIQQAHRRFSPVGRLERQRRS